MGPSLSAVSHSILESQPEDLLLRTSYLTDCLNVSFHRSRFLEKDCSAKFIWEMKQTSVGELGSNTKREDSQ